MTTTHDELTTIASDLGREHSAEMMVAATTYHFASNLLQHYGQANGASFDSQQTMLRVWIDAWLRDNNESAGTFHAALSALRRSGQTVTLIDALPS